LGTNILCMDTYYEERLPLVLGLSRRVDCWAYLASLCIFYKCSWWFFPCYFDLYVWNVFESRLTFNIWLHQRTWILLWYLNVNFYLHFNYFHSSYYRLNIKLYLSNILTSKLLIYVELVLNRFFNNSSISNRFITSHICFNTFWH